MELTFTARLMVAVPLREVAQEVVDKRKVTKYNENTGKPYKKELRSNPRVVLGSLSVKGQIEDFNRILDLETAIKESGSSLELVFVKWSLGCEINQFYLARVIACTDGYSGDGASVVKIREDKIAKEIEAFNKAIKKLGIPKCKPMIYLHRDIE